jgi:hypothetical protein
MVVREPSLRLLSHRDGIHRAARKPVFKHVQRVSVEIIALFLLLPFQLGKPRSHSASTIMAHALFFAVLALVTSSSGLNRDVIQVALEVSVLATCILSEVYRAISHRRLT